MVAAPSCALGVRAATRAGESRQSNHSAAARQRYEAVMSSGSGCCRGSCERGSGVSRRTELRSRAHAILLASGLPIRPGPYRLLDRRGEDRTAQTAPRPSQKPVACGAQHDHRRGLAGHDAATANFRTDDRRLGLPPALQRQLALHRLDERSATKARTPSVRRREQVHSQSPAGRARPQHPNE